MVVSTDESINNVAIRRCTTPLKTYQFICYDLLCVCVCVSFIYRPAAKQPENYLSHMVHGISSCRCVCVCFCVCSRRPILLTAWISVYSLIYTYCPWHDYEVDHFFTRSSSVPPYLILIAYLNKIHCEYGCLSQLTSFFCIESTYQKKPTNTHTHWEFIRRIFWKTQKLWRKHKALCFHSMSRHWLFVYLKSTHNLFC